MVMAALKLGLAVRLILENSEIEKLFPATSTRTLLLLAAPLTSPAMLHLVLAVRTLSVRTLTMEILLLLGEAALFIAIVSPLLIGNRLTFAGDECGRWLRSCPDEVIWLPLWWTQPAGIAIGSLLIMGVTVYALSEERH